MIEKLEVENFTAFEKVEFDFSPGLNLIIGDNGTGKTHLLKLLYAVSESSTGDEDRPGRLISKIGDVFAPTGSGVKRLVRGQGDARARMSSGDLLVELTLGARSSRRAEGSPHSFGKATYIPVKEMLGHARGFQSLYRLRDLSFEEVYSDILDRAFLPALREANPAYQPLCNKIELVIGGQVKARGDEFYLVEGSRELELGLVAEGWRKLALLWLLLRNGSLETGSLLFWDEPEANLNPKALPLVVEVLLTIAREGDQVFVATHSDVLLKEFDLQRRDEPVRHFSLFRDPLGAVLVASAERYSDLEPNALEEENARLFDEGIRRGFAPTTPAASGE